MYKECAVEKKHSEQEQFRVCIVLTLLLVYDNVLLVYAQVLYSEG